MNLRISSDKRRRRLICGVSRPDLIFLMCCALAAFAHPQNSAHPSESPMNNPIRSYLQPLADDQTFAGAVALVSTGDRVLDVQAVGYSDLAAKAPMRDDSMFWIASTSKPMTVTAFMTLVDEGKVSLDDPVEK